MDKTIFDGLVKELADITREYVAAVTGPLIQRIQELEKSLANIPAGPKGDNGDPGQDGKEVSPETIAQLVAAAVDALPKPKDGIDGKDGFNGKDVDPEQIASLVAKAVSELPKPKDGIDGKDGESVHPDTVYRMISELVAMEAGKIKQPEDGAPGRDALQIDILPSIDKSKSYDRGTYAEYAGGVIRAIRNTDPITDSLEKSGWLVVVNGIDHESEEVLDEGRTIKRTTTYTNGRQVVREHKTSIIIYRDVYKSDQFYSRGDFVTWAGSVWHCQSQEPTKDEPGTGSKAWRLAVKRGRDGKNEPVRLK
jgi:hypothetical protein